MTGALLILSVGLLLGLRHAADADHVIAVSTIVSRDRSVLRAARIGAMWGVGHTATIVAVGAPLILFRWTISPRLGAAMELAVAFMLIILGITSLIDVRRGAKSHAHLHQHGDRIHRHPHGHAEAEALREAQAKHRNEKHDETLHGHREDETLLARLDRMMGRLRSYQLVRPLVVGAIHGLAGSAAIALLVLSTIQEPLLAIAYLVVFGVGTILGMTLLTTLIAVPVIASGNASLAANRSLRIGLALASLSFGLFLAVRIGVPLAQM
jgi:high-affinity nickel-transport protein